MKINKNLSTIIGFVLIVIGIILIFISFSNESYNQGLEDGAELIQLDILEIILDCDYAQLEFQGEVFNLVWDKCLELGE